MPDVLIAYASTHGHTRKIAEYAAATLEADGHAPRLCDLIAGDAPDPAAFDRVLVAASVHAGMHQRAAVDWIRRYRSALNARPSALLSVSLTAADDSEEARETTRAIVDELLSTTGWQPTFARPVAGAFQWDSYSLPTRVLMRLIARRHGASTDRSVDAVYTDWDAVAAAARDLAGSSAAIAVGPGA